MNAPNNSLRLPSSHPASAADSGEGRKALLRSSADGKKVIATFAKNKRGDFIRVSLSEYEGFKLLDVRQTFIADGGAHLGTKKGVSISIHLLDELLRALSAARTEAFRMGWLHDESSEQKAA